MTEAERLATRVEKHHRIARETRRLDEEARAAEALAFETFRDAYKYVPEDVVREMYDEQRKGKAK